MRGLVCLCLVALAACSGGSRTDSTSTNTGGASSEVTSAGSPDLLELTALMSAANGYLGAGADCSFTATAEATELTLTVESGLDAVTLVIPNSASVARTNTASADGTVTAHFAIDGIGAVDLGDASIVVTDAKGFAVTCAESAE